jgi:hypothetical protein
MRCSTFLLPVAFLATHVVADGAAIVAAIGTILNATTALNTTVASFPDNPFLDLLYVIPSLTGVSQANLTVTCPKTESFIRNVHSNVCVALLALCL